MYRWATYICIVHMYEYEYMVFMSKMTKHYTIFLNMKKNRKFSNVSIKYLLPNLFSCFRGGNSEFDEQKIKLKENFQVTKEIVWCRSALRQIAECSKSPEYQVQIWTKIDRIYEYMYVLYVRCVIPRAQMTAFKLCIFLYIHKRATSVVRLEKWFWQFVRRHIWFSKCRIIINDNKPLIQCLQLKKIICPALIRKFRIPNEFCFEFLSWKLIYAIICIFIHRNFISFENRVRTSKRPRATCEQLHTCLRLCILSK